MADGYWGPASSSIDWCEENYIVSWYVAEFLNSTTSLFITAAGLLPLALHRPLWSRLEPRFLLALLCVAVVGLGSVAFHGTLQFRHQMWDEVPMLWTVVVMLYCLLEQQHAVPKYSWKLSLPLALYAAFATVATSQQDGSAQWFSFHTLFAACELPALALVWRFYRALPAGEESLRSLLKAGFWSYLLAICVWLTDLNGCDLLQRLPGYSYWNLHAFGWHLLTSCGLYAMMLGLWYHRLRLVRQVPVSLQLSLVPRMVLLEKQA